MYVAENGPGDEVSSYVMPAYAACVPEGLRQVLLADSEPMSEVAGLRLIRDVARDV